MKWNAAAIAIAAGGLEHQRRLLNKPFSGADLDLAVRHTIRSRPRRTTSCQCGGAGAENRGHHLTGLCPPRPCIHSYRALDCEINAFEASPSRARFCVVVFVRRRRSGVDRLDHTWRCEMKFLPGAVIVDPISEHVFAIPSATPTLMTAMPWQRRLDDLPPHRWLRRLVLRVARTL